jgi:hypothetical protein
MEIFNLKQLNYVEVKDTVTRLKSEIGLQLWKICMTTTTMMMMMMMMMMMWTSVELGKV